MHAIHKKYTYNHVHDVALLQIILTEVAGACTCTKRRDSAFSHQLCFIPPHNDRWWHQLRIHWICVWYKLQQQIFGGGTQAPWTWSQNGGREKKKKDKDNKDNKDDKDKEPTKNSFPHCKKFHCKKPHHVNLDKCLWNKKCKGYCFKFICDKSQGGFQFQATPQFMADWTGSRRMIGRMTTMGV